MTHEEYSQSALSLTNKIVELVADHMRGVPDYRRKSMREVAVVNYMARVIVAHSLEGRTFDDAEKVALAVAKRFEFIEKKLLECIEIVLGDYLKTGDA